MTISTGIRDVIWTILTQIVRMVFYPDVLSVAAAVCVISAAYMHWGREGALWAGGLLAFLFGQANIPRSGK
jgi:hypothetical protein